MSILFEMYKELGMGVVFNGTDYALRYLRENERSKDFGYPKCHDYSLMTYSNQRIVFFTTRVDETGAARVSSIKNGNLFTVNEAEMLRSKGQVLVSKKLVQN